MIDDNLRRSEHGLPLWLGGWLLNTENLVDDLLIWLVAVQADLRLCRLLPLAVILGGLVAPQADLAVVCRGGLRHGHVFRMNNSRSSQALAFALALP